MAALSQSELGEFQRAFERVLQALRHFQAEMTERDRQFLQLGLRSAHIEEAIAHGELERAHEHFAKLMEIAKAMSGLRAQAGAPRVGP